MNLFAGQQWQHRQKRTDLWAQWEMGRVGRIETGALKHTLPYVKRIFSGNLLCMQGAQPGLCDNLEGREGGSEGGDICILMADSRCIAQTNTTFKKNYPSITNKLKKNVSVYLFTNLSRKGQGLFFEYCLLIRVLFSSFKPLYTRYNFQF